MAPGLKVARRALPAEILHRVEDRNIKSQRCESAKEQGVIPCAKQRLGQSASLADRRMPFAPILGDIFQMKVLRKRESRRLRAPSRQSRITVGIVADYGQIIGNRLRPHAEFCDDRRFIAHNLAPSVALDYSRAHDRLSQILIGSTNYYLTHTLVLRCIERGGS